MIDWKFEDLNADAGVTSPFSKETCLSAVNIAPEWQIEDGPVSFWINNAFLVGQSLVVCIKENDKTFCLDESSPYIGRSADLYKRMLTENESRIAPIYHQGSYALLAGEWSGNFWHWFTEYFPYACLLEKRGYTGKYIISSSLPIYIESLHLLGIDHDRIVPLDWLPRHVEKLLVFRRLAGQQIDQSPPIVHLTAAEMRKKVQPVRANRRLFIARRGVRSLCNENEVEERLFPLGFEKVYMEDYALLDQIQLAVESECIVGPHGAGMTAALFMQPRGSVIEFFAPTYINPCMIGVCQVLKHRYRMCVTRQFDYPYPFAGQIKVEPDMLSAALQGLNNVQ